MGCTILSMHIQGKTATWSEHRLGARTEPNVLFEVLERPVTKAKFCPHLGRRISKPDGRSGHVESESRSAVDRPTGRQSLIEGRRDMDRHMLSTGQHMADPFLQPDSTPGNGRGFSLQVATCDQVLRLALTASITHRSRLLLAVTSTKGRLPIGLPPTARPPRGKEDSLKRSLSDIPNRR